jgi:putative acetyltransferase
MNIQIDDLQGVQIANLLQQHMHDMTLHSPPESVHALNLDDLRKTGITFWSLWENNDLAGCGALKQLSKDHGEIKSMRTAVAYLRQGVARKLLIHILNEAQIRGYKRLSLETGSMAAFDPARRLYETLGFQYCPPFADYIDDPNSVFMCKKLGS